MAAERVRAAGEAGKSGPYHHGDLRNALLAAAEAVLAERGVEGFTLRECARRAGVSHAAPAHHFGDVTGLLTALAVVGFETLTAAMREARAGIEDPPERLRAIGRGYVAFARRYPERFRLIFSAHRLNHDDPDLSDAGAAAFAELETAVRLVAGAADPPLAGELRLVAGAADPPLAGEVQVAVVNAWSVVHGFSHLLLQGQLAFFLGGNAEAALDDLLQGVLNRLTPTPAEGGRSDVAPGLPAET
jgi:AcrR family transcriptional regulator